MYRHPISRGSSAPNSDVQLPVPRGRSARRGEDGSPFSFFNPSCAASQQPPLQSGTDDRHPNERPRMPFRKEMRGMPKSLSTGAWENQPNGEAPMRRRLAAERLPSRRTSAHSARLSGHPSEHTPKALRREKRSRQRGFPAKKCLLSSFQALAETADLAAVSEAHGGSSAAQVRVHPGTKEDATLVGSTPNARNPRFSLPGKESVAQVRVEVPRGRPPLSLSCAHTASAPPLNVGKRGRRTRAGLGSIFDFLRIFHGRKTPRRASEVDCSLPPSALPTTAAL